MNRRTMLLSLGLVAATAGLAGSPACAGPMPWPIRSTQFLPASVSIFDPVDGPILLTGGFELGTQVAVPPNPTTPPVECVFLAAGLLSAFGVGAAEAATSCPPGNSFPFWKGGSE